MNTCIIAIAKYENLYIQEWVNYHLNIGFDRIFVCDNNDSDGEKISDVINDERVTILDYHDMRGVQTSAYTETFVKYKNEFDWLAFIDIDEFIILDEKYHNNIKEFLSDHIFDDADIVRLSWKVLTCENELDVKDGNYNVLDRIKDVHISREECLVKSIIRGNVEYVGGKVSGHGYFENASLKAKTADGEWCDNVWIKIRRGPIYENAWINHYPTKTMGEYVRQKYFRGGPNFNNGRYCHFRYFFKYNKETEEKRKYGEELIQELLKNEKNNAFYRRFVLHIKDENNK
jgi:hypothetical protein